MTEQSASGQPFVVRPDQVRVVTTAPTGSHMFGFDSQGVPFQVPATALAGSVNPNQVAAQVNAQVVAPATLALIAQALAALPGGGGTGGGGAGAGPGSINAIADLNASTAFTVSGSYGSKTPPFTYATVLNGAQSAFAALPGTSPVNTTARTFSFTVPASAFASGGTGSVIVKDNAGATLTSNNFAVTAPAIASIAAIGQQTVGASFAVTGTLQGYSAPPTLQYALNGGAWQTIVSGVTARDFAFTVPGPAAAGNANSIAVRDANRTSVSRTSNTFLISPAAPTIVITGVTPATLNASTGAGGAVIGSLTPVSAGGALVNPAFSMPDSAGGDFQITAGGQVALLPSNVPAGTYTVHVQVSASNAATSAPFPVTIVLTAPPTAGQATPPAVGNFTGVNDTTLTVTGGGTQPLVLSQTSQAAENIAMRVMPLAAGPRTWTAIVKIDDPVVPNTNAGLTLRNSANGHLVNLLGYMADGTISVFYYNDPATWTGSYGNSITSIDLSRPIGLRIVDDGTSWTFLASQTANANDWTSVASVTKATAGAVNQIGFFNDNYATAPNAAGSLTVYHWETTTGANPQAAAAIGIGALPGGTGSTGVVGGVVPVITAFTPVNASTATLTGGGTVPLVASVAHQPVTADHLVSWVMPLPSGAQTFTALLHLANLPGHSSAGITTRNATTGAQATLSVSPALSPPLAAFAFSNPATYASTIAAPAGSTISPNGVFALRGVFDGTTWTFAVSPSAAANSWVQIGTGSAATFGSPNQIGFYVDAIGGTAAGTATLTLLDWEVAAGANLQASATASIVAGSGGVLSVPAAGGGGGTATTGPSRVPQDGLARGIYGPRALGHGVGWNTNDRLGSYFARGITGVLNWTFGGPDASNFSFTSRHELWVQIGAYSAPAGTVFNLTLGCDNSPSGGTDSIPPIAITVTKGTANALKGVNNWLCTSDFAHSNNPGLGYVDGGASALGGADAGLFFLDPYSGIFASNAASPISAHWGAHSITVTTPWGVINRQVWFIDSVEPEMAWIPGGSVYDNAANGQVIGQILAYTDTNEISITSDDPLTTVNPAGQLLVNGSFAGLANTTRRVNVTANCWGQTKLLPVDVPVLAGQVVQASAITNTFSQSLDNSMTNGRLGTATAAGFVNPAVYLTMVDDALQGNPVQQLGAFGGGPTPRYNWTVSGNVVTVDYTYLSAHTDTIRLTFVEGPKTAVADIPVTIAAKVGPTVHVGDTGGMDFASWNDVCSAAWANPAQYAGVNIVLHPRADNYVNDFTHNLLGHGANQQWFPGPATWGGVSPQQRTLVDFHGTAPLHAGQGGMGNGGNFDITINNLIVWRAGNGTNAGNIYGTNQTFGDITVNDTVLVDGENGFLDGAVGSHLNFNRCVFLKFGLGDSGHTHCWYAGHVSVVTQTDCVSLSSYIGHTAKTRARITRIIRGFYGDGENGRSSRCFDIPVGGIASIKGTVLLKGTNPDNNGEMVGYGAESGGVNPAWDVNSLDIEDCTFLNCMAPTAISSQVTAIAMWPCVSPTTGLPATGTFLRNKFYNIPRSRWCASSGGNSAPLPTFDSSNVSIAAFPGFNPGDPSTGGNLGFIDAISPLGWTNGPGKFVRDIFGQISVNAYTVAAGYTGKVATLYFPDDHGVVVANPTFTITTNSAGNRYHFNGSDLMVTNAADALDFVYIEASGNDSFNAPITAAGWRWIVGGNGTIAGAAAPGGAAGAAITAGATFATLPFQAVDAVPVGTPLTAAHNFVKGDLPAGSWNKLAATMGGQTASVQVDQANAWPDGSLRTASLSLLSPVAVAAGAQSPIAVSVAAAAVTGSRLTPAQFAAVCDINVKVTGDEYGSDTFSVHLNDIVASFPEKTDAAVVGNYPLGGWETIRAGKRCTEFHGWRYLKRDRDGASHSQVKAVLFARVWLDDNGAPVGVDCIAGGFQENTYGPMPGATVGGTTQSYFNGSWTVCNGNTVLFTPLGQQQFHPTTRTRRGWWSAEPDGTRHWVSLNGTPKPRYMLGHDRAYAIKSRVIPPYDLTVADSYPAQINMQTSNWSYMLSSPNNSFMGTDFGGIEMSGDALGDPRYGALDSNSVCLFLNPLDWNRHVSVLSNAWGWADWEFHVIDERSGYPVNPGTSATCPSPANSSLRFFGNQSGVHGSPPTWAIGDTSGFYHGFAYGPDWDCSHVPSPWIMGYLRTGDAAFLRDAELQTSMQCGGIAEGDRNYTVNSKSYELASTGRGAAISGERAIGNYIRQAGFTDRLMRDASPMRGFVRKMMDQMAQSFADLSPAVLYSDTLGASRFGLLWTYASESYPIAPTSAGPFPHIFMIGAAALHIAHEAYVADFPGYQVGITNVANFFALFAGSRGGSSYDLSIYSLAFSPDGSSWFADWASMRAANAQYVQGGVNGFGPYPNVGFRYDGGNLGSGGIPNIASFPRAAIWMMAHLDNPPPFAIEVATETWARYKATFPGLPCHVPYLSGGDIGPTFCIGPPDSIRNA